MSTRDGNSIDRPRRGREPPRFVTVEEHNEGQRIDNFLLTTLKRVPRSHIYRCLRKGEVRVNKGRVRQHFRLRVGDVIRIPPVEVPVEPARARPGGPVLDLLANSILYEDRGIIVLNKPAGIAVHGGSAVAFGVIEALRAARANAPYLELVHRLDRETSGCLLVAKKRSVLRELHQALRARSLDKQYVALVQGNWRGGPRAVTAPLRRTVLRSGERRVHVAEPGKPSATLFRPLDTGALASLVLACPRTGRTHQIRVHAAVAGHPIAGDEKYGGEQFNQSLRKLGLRRLFLHAWSLRFFNPGTGQWLTITAPLPETLHATLAKLGLTFEPTNS